VYSGNSKDQTLNRAQEKEKIKTSDKKFDEMFCMFDRDLRLLIDRCLKKKESNMIWDLHNED
jgi:hypothetical protein